MAYLTIVINDPKHPVGDLNSRTQNPVNPHEAVNLLRDYLSGVAGGTINANVQITTRGSDPGVTTDGDPASEQFNYNLL